MVKEIDSSELQDQIVAGDELQLFDIRSDSEVAQGILPNAVHLPMHLIPVKIHDVPKDCKVVLYCHSGARSFHACQFLMQHGYDNVINLRGGILAWARHGFDIVSLRR